MIIASCLICLEIFGNKESLSVLCCGHIYHQKCLITWFKTKKNCPSCRCVQGSKKYVEKIFFDTIDNPSSNDLENFNETEAMLNGLITQLQVENRVLSEKINDINQTNEKQMLKLKLENKHLNQNNQVFLSLNKSISKTLETTRAENLQIQIEKSIVENEISLLKNEIKKLNFIKEILKDETGEISEKIKSIQISSDINSQIEIISSALVISNKCKITANESNAKLQNELNNVKKINRKLTLRIAEAQENIQVMHNEVKSNKIQLAELEKQFKSPNVNISMPIRKESVLNISEFEIEKLDSSYNSSYNENSFTDSSNDISPSVSIINSNNVNPFPVVSFKKRPLDLLSNLSIMRKSSNTAQILNSAPKLFDAPAYNNNNNYSNNNINNNNSIKSSNKKLEPKHSNPHIFRNLKRKVVDPQTSITKYFK